MINYKDRLLDEINKFHVALVGKENSALPEEKDKYKIALAVIEKLHQIACKLPYDEADALQIELQTLKKEINQEDIPF